MGRRKQRIFTGKLEPGELQPSPPLDVDVVVAIDHDLGDRRVAEELPHGLQEMEDRPLEDFLEPQGLVRLSRLGLSWPHGRTLSYSITYYTT